MSKKSLSKTNKPLTFHNVVIDCFVDILHTDLTHDQIVVLKRHLNKLRYVK